MQGNARYSVLLLSGRGNTMDHKGTIVLETERLILRPFSESDAQAVFENWASDDEVTKYLTWPTHKSAEQSLGYMKYCVKCYEEPNNYQWGIERKEDHTLIGNISVVRLDEEVDGAELGWVIGRSYWGKGYTPEAAKRVVDFLFDEVGARRVSARHDPNNPNSGRVMQKIGMKYEGTLRQCDRNNQGIVDLCYYSILRSER